MYDDSVVYGGRKLRATGNKNISEKVHIIFLLTLSMKIVTSQLCVSWLSFGLNMTMRDEIRRFCLEYYFFDVIKSVMLASP